MKLEKSAARNAVSAFVLLALATTLFGAEKPPVLIKQGIAADSAGNWQEARGDFLSALAQQPKNKEAAFRLGRLDLEHDSLAAGTNLLERADSLRYDPFEVNRWLGRAYARQGNYSSAVEHYRNALDAKPKSQVELTEVRIELGTLYEENGSYDEALEQDSLVLAGNPKSASGHLLRGKIHHGQRNFDQAIDEYRRAVTLDTSLTSVYLDLAGLFKARPDGFDSAADYYRRYLAVAPDDASVNFNFSGLFYAQSRNDTAHRVIYSDSAMVYVKKAIDLGFNEDIERVYGYYVDVARAARNRAGSITALQTYLQNHPNDGYKWALLGNIWADSGNVQQAIASFKMAAGYDTTLARRTLVWIAQQYYKQARYDSCIAYYTKVIAIDPKAASAYINRAYAYVKSGNQTQAVNDLEQGTNLDPKNVKAKVYMLSLKMSSAYNDKDYNAALDYAKQILDLDPGNAAATSVEKGVEAIRKPQPKPEE